MKPLTISIVVLTALGACSSSGSDAPAPDRSSATPSAQDQTMIESSRRSTEAPRSFKRRTTFPSCGDRAGSGVSPPRTLGGFACLRSAVTGNGGELTVLRRTNEGDPVITYYRTGPGIRAAEVFTDWTLDDFGHGGWTRETWSIKRLQKELASFEG